MDKKSSLIYGLEMKNGMDQTVRILYAEDDETLSFVTKDNLELKGYEVTHCPDGLSALQAFKDQRFDICILDIMLPELDGFTLAREIRKRDLDVPLIFLTAKSLKEDKIEGLQIGADDYMIKPFSIVELLLKIQVFLRRSRIRVEEKAPIYRLGAYEVDFDNLQLTHQSDSRTLTQREAELLQYFVDHKNQILKRSQILEKIWGKDDYFLGRSLDVFVSRLRKYLKKDTTLEIENIHGIGFRFNQQD